MLFFFFFFGGGPGVQEEIITRTLAGPKLSAQVRVTFQKHH